MSTRSQWLTLAGAVAAVTLMVWTARPAGTGIGWRLAFVATHLASFGALWLVLGRMSVTRTSLMVGAVVLRLAALPMHPTLSDDGYRYVWDGVVSKEADVSPYDHRPSDPALERWQTEPMYTSLNSPDYYSVYPPASQVVFRASAAVYRWWGFNGSWRVLKLLLVLIELAGILALTRVVRPGLVAFYAWSPLAVIEISGQGHTEGLVVGALGLLLGVASGARPIRSAAATVAGAVKLYPFALLPLAWRREGLPGVAISAVILGLLILPVWSPDARAHITESVGLFFGTLDWFSGPYLLLKAALYGLVGDEAGSIASALLTLAAALVVAGAALTDDGTSSRFARGVAWIVIAGVLSAATLHPWYLVPVLFIMPLLQNHLWIVSLAATTSVSYLSYEAGAAVQGILLVTTWGLVLFAALWEWKRPADRAENLGNI